MVPVNNCILFTAYEETLIFKQKKTTQCWQKTGFDYIFILMGILNQYYQNLWQERTYQSLSDFVFIEGFVQFLFWLVCFWPRPLADTQ